jgi:hypothetical protein
MRMRDVRILSEGVPSFVTMSILKQLKICKPSWDYGVKLRVILLGERVEMVYRLTSEKPHASAIVCCPAKKRDKRETEDKTPLLASIRSAG